MECKEYIWVIQGFDLITWKPFTPSPGAFKTEREAQWWVEAHDKDHKGTIRYSYQKVGVGRFG